MRSRSHVGSSSRVGSFARRETGSSMLFNALAFLQVTYAASTFLAGDEIRVEFSKADGSEMSPTEARRVSFELSTVNQKTGEVVQWQQTKVVGAGDETSEETKVCPKGGCDKDALLREVFDLAEKPDATNLLFIRAGSSKRMLLRLRDGKRLEGPVLGALFADPHAFLSTMTYKEIVATAPAVRPAGATASKPDELQIEDSIFMMHPPDL